MPNTIKVKRGLESNRTSITPAAGELLYTTDQKKVYIGDGTTAGGVAVAPTVTQQVDLIATANASGAATVDFTGLSSAYAEYFLVVQGLYASASDTIYIRTSSNNGSTWDSSADQYASSSNYNSGTSNLVTQSSATGVNTVQSITASTNGNYLFLRLVNAGVSQFAGIEGVIGYGLSGLGASNFGRFLGFRKSTTPANGLRILCIGGSTLTGTFKLYGVKA